VVPSQDIVAVFTAGLKWTDYLPMRLVEFFVIPAAQASGPLPDNPHGMTLLNSIVQAVEHPMPQPVSRLPEVAQSISGKTYDLGANSLRWKSFSLSFQEQVALLTLFAENARLELPIGMDSVFRITNVEQHPVALKGFWQDDQTFVVYQQILGEADRVELTFRFERDSVTISSRWFIEGGLEVFGGRTIE
jgi:hypothetical protein